MGHALLSPSAAKRWLACPGSVRACEGLPSPDTRYSAEGTFLHAIAAKVLTDDLDSAASLVGTEGTEAGFTFTLDDVAAAQVDAYVAAVRGVVMLGGELRVEQRVALSDQCYGTADAIVWVTRDGDSFAELHVFDLKMGAGQFVVVEGNEQMLTYAAGELARLGRSGPGGPQRIVLHIVQPRCLDGEGRAHRRWETDAGTVFEHSRRIANVELNTIYATEPDATRVAGDHCRFCPAKDGCPALASAAMEAARELFPDTSDALQAVPVAPPALADLSNERLAAVLRAADAAEQWIASIRGEAFARAMRGQPLPGLKLVRGLGNRRWRNDADTARAMAEHGVEPWAPRVLASPAQIEKRHPEMRSLVAKLTERPFTKPKLVSESNNLPAYVPDPTADFEALPAADDS